MVKCPKPGERVLTKRRGIVEVLAVAMGGVALTVRDADGYRVGMQRTDEGWWSVLVEVPTTRELPLAGTHGPTEYRTRRAPQR